MIDLSTIVQLHDRDKTIRRHCRILEELFYLCINDSFITTIQNTRERLRSMATKVYAEFPCNMDTAVNLRNEIYGDDYRQILTEVSERHRYFHPSFTRDYLQVSSDSDMRQKFNVLENIIYFNNPLPYNNPREHFNSRSGYMEVAYDEIEGPYIRMHFDIGTTLQEIKDIIDKDFPETQNLQVNKFNISTKQYRKDTNLRKKSIIHNCYKEGQKDTQIAVVLDNDGNYGEENLAEQIRAQRTRTQEAVDRYNAYD